ncbi:response regulator transcription factor [Burkholderia sp. BE17]|uniref:response regulator transcription factor n=1 Tax=Burkholderia sp. BE17 TaxID=2656644 RepID=UPI00187B4823|nr:response regulator transcription factor [Burkholderia sp. BE17]
MQLIDTNDPDIALVDWTRPGADRLSTLLHVRQRSAAPIVLSVDGDTPEDRVTAGLNAGADVNITATIGSLESLARINALIRRAHAGQMIARNSPVFGEFRFSPGEFCVERNGIKIRLSSKEFDIAMLLFKRMSTPVSRRSIALVMWGDGERTASRGIDTYVSAVRRKLGLHAENGYSLHAVYGHGYQLDRTSARGGSGDHAVDTSN